MHVRCEKNRKMCINIIIYQRLDGQRQGKSIQRCHRLTNHIRWN